MRRWDSFLKMVKDARRHSSSKGSVMQPYRDFTQQTVGFACETTGEVWQIDVVAMDKSLSGFPEVVAMMRAREALDLLARAVTRGFGDVKIPSAMRKAMGLLERECA